MCEVVSWKGPKGTKLDTILVSLVYLKQLDPRIPFHGASSRMHTPGIGLRDGEKLASVTQAQYRQAFHKRHGGGDQDY